MAAAPVEPAVRLIEVITAIALIAGPILAVFVTRYVDGLRDKKAKRLHLFKTIMRTRGSRLNPDHVGALNLIEIEFYNEKRVLDALEKYFDHLNNGGMPNLDAWIKNSDHFLTKLLYEMARSLGYKIEQLKILSGGYSPRGWIENEERQAEVQKRLLAVLKGEAAIPVCAGNIPTQTATPAHTGPNGATPNGFAVPPGFPPPPAAE